MKIAELETALGKIIVEQSGYTAEGYPGYYISLTKDGKELAVAMFEVDETDDEPECKIHVWDTTKDEPICDLHGFVYGDGLELTEY